MSHSCSTPWWQHLIGKIASFPLTFLHTFYVRDSHCTTWSGSTPSHLWLRCWILSASRSCHLLLLLLLLLEDVVVEARDHSGPSLMYVVPPSLLPKLGTIFSAVVSNPEYCFSHEINVSLFLIVSIWSLEWMHSALTKGLHGCTGEKKNGRRLKKRKRGWPHGSCPQLSKDINRQNTHTCKSHKPSHRKNIGMPPSVLFLWCLRALHRWKLRQITF